MATKKKDEKKEVALGGYPYICYTCAMERGGQAKDVSSAGRFEVCPYCKGKNQVNGEGLKKLSVYTWKEEAK
jgi:hypothetical protein